MASFLESNLFTALVTLLVGSVAIFLYIKGKSDEKRDAASIILLEIKGAERKIKGAKNLEATNEEDFTPLIKEESWTKYKYLFVKEFDRDEWDSLNDFYEKCALYDEAITNGSQSFPKNEEQIRINAHRISADYLSSALDSLNRAKSAEEKNKIVEDAKTKAEAFEELYLVNNEGSNFISRPLYTPRKYAQDRIRFANLIDSDISSKPVGQKLKKIAKIKP